MRVTSAIAAWKDGSSTVLLVLWIRTESPWGCLNPSASTALTWPDSPAPDLIGSSVFVPSALPIMNAATTNASQPKIAVFLWPALQRPIRAARLLERFVSPTVASTVSVPFAGSAGSFWMIRVFITAPGS